MPSVLNNNIISVCCVLGRYLVFVDKTQPIFRDFREENKSPKTERQNNTEK